MPGCGEDDSSSMIGSISSIASQLDTVANYQPNPRKAKSLHDKATSLQLSSWAMVQLKHAVKLFYSQVSKEQSSSRFSFPESQYHVGIEFLAIFVFQTHIDDDQVISTLVRRSMSLASASSSLYINT